MFFPWEVRLQATHEVGNSVLLTPVLIPPVDLNIESQNQSQNGLGWKGL